MRKWIVLGALGIFGILLAGFGITVWEGVPPDTAVFVDPNERTYATRQCVGDHTTETQYVSKQEEVHTPVGGTVGGAPVTVMTLQDVQNAPQTAGYRKDDVCVRANGFLRPTGTLFSDLLERVRYSR
jgi:hypothetical protein